MPRTIRFHLDEVCDPRIASGLRQRGVDVTTARDADLLGVSDEGHLAFALLHSRVILTHDTDFLRLHAAGARHAGIVYCPMQASALGELVRALVLIWEILEHDELEGQVQFL